jgi:hypothetical protein
MPMDPQSGGTWIAANSAGVVLATLNVNSSNRAVAYGNTSRGRIIPMLMGAESADDAVDAAKQLDHREFAPFRLVAIDRASVASLRFDGDRTTIESNVILEPAMFTSSGLGDAFVEAPRRALFRQMIWAIESQSSAQDAFHRHRWADRPHLSVNMIRPGARTVSRTNVEIDNHRVAMAYQATRAREEIVAHMDLQYREAVGA